MNIDDVRKYQLNFYVSNVVFNYSIRFVQEIHEMNYVDLHGTAVLNIIKKTSAYSLQVESIIYTTTELLQ